MAGYPAAAVVVGLPISAGLHMCQQAGGGPDLPAAGATPGGDCPPQPDLSRLREVLASGASALMLMVFAGVIMVLAHQMSLSGF